MSRLALAILAGSLTSAAALAEDVLTMPIERRPVVHGIAAKYPLDRGVVADPQVIFASGFENGFQGFTSFRHKQNCSVRKDAEVAHSGGACAEITATRGRDEGGGLRYKWQAGPGTVYFRFYCKFHKDTVRPHHFVSLTATAPDYRPGGRAGLRRTGVDSYVQYAKWCDAFL